VAIPLGVDESRFSDGWVYWLTISRVSAKRANKDIPKRGKSVEVYPERNLERPLKRDRPAVKLQQDWGMLQHVFHDFFRSCGDPGHQALSETRHKYLSAEASTFEER